MLGPETLKTPIIVLEPQSYDQSGEVNEDVTYQTDGGLTRPEKLFLDPAWHICQQRRVQKAPVGKGLNKTIRWVHRAHVKSHGVMQMPGAFYDKVTNEEYASQIPQGHSQLLRIDTIVVCADKITSRQ